MHVADHDDAALAARTQQDRRLARREVLRLVEQEHVVPVEALRRPPQMQQLDVCVVRTRHRPPAPRAPGADELPEHLGGLGDRPGGQVRVLSECARDVRVGADPRVARLHEALHCAQHVRGHRGRRKLVALPLCLVACAAALGQPPREQARHVPGAQVAERLPAGQGHLLQRDRVHRAAVHVGREAHPGGLGRRRVERNVQEALLRPPRSVREQRLRLARAGERLHTDELPGVHVVRNKARLLGGEAQHSGVAAAERRLRRE